MMAAELGCASASISCVTNRATGLADARLDHQDVTVIADIAAPKVRAILGEFLREEASRPAERSGATARIRELT